jgi:homoserine dehydrogenase
MRRKLMNAIQVGLLGCGTVGTGVARLLLENRDVIRARLGADLNLKYVADLDTETDRGIVFPPGVFISEASRVITDPEVDIVVEMIGGKTAAREMIQAAIAAGKHVVTANKALLADGGNELVDHAQRQGVDLAYEASVGGCMPIIKSVRESLVGNRISAMTGILNGTCNCILTRITEEGATYEAALADAQAEGFAEADPTLDVEGMDTAHKLAILNALAHGMEINLSDIHVEGIRQITPMDIEFAKSFGYTIKLLAIGKRHGDCVEARVHPTMIDNTNPLSHVDHSMNAIAIDADATGKTMLYGHGAGMMPTASAVLSDIADIARNIMSGTTGRVPILGYPRENIRHIPILSMNELMTRYYMRFEAQDHPGVLSRISGILGENKISINSVQQHGRNASGSVPVVMITHIAKEAWIQRALSQIAVTDCVVKQPMVIRIEDEVAK